MLDSTTTPPRVIEGYFTIKQSGLLDPFSGQEAKMNLYVKSSTDLNGKELKVQLGTGTDCTIAAAGTTAAVVVSHPILWRRNLKELF